ncbi:MAG TPA: hypothetical protein VFX86_04205 [Candidatus Saccharimonadales bacterium]|nr:hypothetical protein [Candidatus Saccharimonadales bacterium]
MNNGQNQNATSQPQSAGGLQTQTAPIPATTAPNSGLQGQGGDLFGNNPDTASLLNQTQVLGTSPPPANTSQNNALEQGGGGVPLTGIIIVAIVLLVVAWLFKLIDSEDKSA